MKKKKLHALPVGTQELVCACFTFPMPLGGSGGKRATMPRIVLAIDKRTGQAHKPILSEPPEGEIWTLDIAVDQLLEHFIAQGSRPKSIRFEGWHFEALESALCEAFKVQEDPKPDPRIYKLFEFLTMQMAMGKLGKA